MKTILFFSTNPLSDGEVRCVEKMCAVNGLMPSDYSFVSCAHIQPHMINDTIGCIMPMGNSALRTFQEADSCDKWRGSILYHHGFERKYIPLVHPGVMIKNWEYMPLCTFDIARAWQEAQTPYSKEHRNLIVAPTYEQVCDYLSDILHHPERFVSFDTETSNNMPTALGFAWQKYEALCIPFVRNEGLTTVDYWTVEQETSIWKMCKEVLEHRDIRKIAQNISYDGTVLWWNYPHIQVNNLWMDTMCAHHTRYLEFPKGLATLCSMYTKYPYYKSMRNTTSDVEFWQYNGLDACITWECAFEIEKDCKEFGVWDFYQQHINPLLPLIVKMQLFGVRIDKDKVQSLTMMYDQMREVKQAALDAYLLEQYNTTLNVNSPKDKARLFYQVMKLPIQRKRVKNEKGDFPVTTDEHAMEVLEKKSGSPVFQYIREITHCKNIISTYLTDLYGDDGRSRCSYLVGGDAEGDGGTETGRLSSRTSIFDTGTNLQNIPPAVRSVFVADPGYILIESDLSQAEARIVAYESEEQNLINLFETGGDIHKSNASWIFNVPQDKVTHEQRQIAKKQVHGFDYGMGERATAIHAGISVAEAMRVRNLYFTQNPGIRVWQRGIESELNRSRTLTNVFGAKRTFYGRWGDSLSRVAYAYKPQSTVAQLLNLIMLKFHTQYPWIPILLQVHDSFVCEVPIEEVHMWVDMIKQCYKYPLTINHRTFTIPGDIKLGHTWGTMEKWEKSDYARTYTLSYSNSHEFVLCHKCNNNRLHYISDNASMIKMCCNQCFHTVSVQEQQDKLEMREVL